MLSKVVTSQKYLFNAARTASNVRNAYARCIYNYDIPTYNFSKQKSHTVVSEKVKSTSEEISTDFGLGHYMTNVYKATGGGMLASLGIAKLLSMTVLATNPVVYLGGALVSLGGIFTFNRSTPEIVYKQVQGKQVPYAEQPLGRKLSYAAIFSGMGMGLSPLIMIADAMNPAIVPLSMALTMFTFGGASLYAYNKPLGSFSKYGGFLSGGLLGLIGMSLISWGSHLIIGPNPFSMAFWRIEPYIAIGLFSGFVAYDTHNAVENYKLGDYDHLSSSVEMYLNIVNLFSSFIRIVMSFFSDN